MNIEQAKEYANTMTYKEAVSNCRNAIGIMYRKATLIKLRELAKIADQLDHAQTIRYEHCHLCGKRVLAQDSPSVVKDLVEEVRKEYDNGYSKDQV